MCVGVYVMNVCASECVYKNYAIYYIPYMCAYLSVLSYKF